jgi:hypothetical protein
VPRRLLAGKGVVLVFRDWLDTRIFPLPGGPERTAAPVAALDDPAATDRPWLLVLEFQARVDPDKLDVRVWKPASGGRQPPVCAANRGLGGRLETGERGASAPCFRHQQGADAPRSPQYPDGLSAPCFRHQQGADAPRSPQYPDGLSAPCWRRPQGADAPRSPQYPDGLCGALVAIALVFAELAGRVPAWKRGLEGWDMTESQVVNEWTRQAESRAKLVERRLALLELLEGRFPGVVPPEVVKLINEQESLELLDDWFRAALRAFSFEQFLAVLRR